MSFTSSKNVKKKYTIDPPKILIWPKNGIKLEVGKLLGKGGYAHCYQVKQPDGHEYAAKLISQEYLKNESNGRKFLNREIDIHKKLIHPSIVRYIDTFDTDTLAVVLLELCSGKTLTDLIKESTRLSIQSVKLYLLNILDGLEYIHSKGIIHRDLKTSNILVSNNSVKICDFGLSKYMTDPVKNRCGTPNYMPPEILEKEDHSRASDIWSLGVVIYTMIVGRPPFETKSIEQTYNRIKAGLYYFPINIQIDNNAKDLIKKLLVNDPTKRLSIAEIRKHDFFSYLGHNNIIPVKGIVNATRESFSKFNRGFPIDHASKDPPKPIFWVYRWIEHPTDGLFYQINNGITGCYFKDHSYIIASDNNIKYASRGKSLQPITTNEKDKQELFNKYIKLLPECCPRPVTQSLIEDQTEHIRIVKFVKTRSSIVFRLSNNTIQVHYKKGGEIIISSEGTVITYIDKGTREPTTYWLDEIPVVLHRYVRHIEKILDKIYPSGIAPK